MPALSQSCLVRGLLNVSATAAGGIGCATSASGIGCTTSASGIASANGAAAPQTLAASFQVMPALSQSSLVRGWLKLSATSDSGIGCTTSASGIASAN